MINFPTSKSNNFFVKLQPCGHSFHEELIENIYGKVRYGFCEQQGKPCIRCKSIVVAYSPDEFSNKLFSKLLEVDLEQRESLKYPGIKGMFPAEEATDHWDQPYDAPDVSGFIRLRSIKENSALQRITLYKDHEGAIHLGIVPLEHADFVNFLSSNNIDFLTGPAVNGLRFCQDRTLLVISNSSQIKKLFEIIISQNIICDNLLDKMLKIIK